MPDVSDVYGEKQKGTKNESFTRRILYKWRGPTEAGRMAERSKVEKTSRISTAPSHVR
jgi:hypothetical protein